MVEGSFLAVTRSFISRNVLFTTIVKLFNGTKKVVSMTLTTCKVVTYVYYEMSKQLFGLSYGG